MPARNLHHPKSQPVAGGQDCGWTRFFLKEVLGRGSAVFLDTPRTFPDFHRTLGPARLNHPEIPLHPTPRYFEASFSQTFLVDGSTESDRMQSERHNTNPLVSKGFDVLRTGAGRCPLVNPDKRDVGERELVDDDHWEAPIDDRLNGYRVFWHSINDKTVNGGASVDAFIAFPALEE